MYRDLAEAAVSLYGDSLYGMHTAHPHQIGGPEREPDDLAEAWLRGEHDRVLTAVALHYAKVRARTVIVKSVSKKRRILDLKRRGWSTLEIARKLDTKPTYIARVSRTSRPRKTSGVVNRSRLSSLRALGWTLKRIAEKEKLSVFTVCRVLRGKQ